jgi:hypothetical protein
MSLYGSTGSYYTLFDINRSFYKIKLRDVGIGVWIELSFYKLDINSVTSIRLRAENKQYLLLLTNEGFKLYNDTDGYGYEIFLPHGYLLLIIQVSFKFQIREIKPLPLIRKLSSPTE